MRYAGMYLKKYGQQVTINREKPATAYAGLKRSSKATSSITARDSMFEGLIEASSALVSGDTFTIGNDTYLVQTADFDHHSGEIIFFSVRTNSIASVLVEEETADENLHLVKEWKSLKSNILCYKEVVTRTQRQHDAGILDNTIYIIQIPKVAEIKELSRVIFDGDTKKYKIESFDNDGLDGVYKIQLSKDTRP